MKFTDLAACPYCGCDEYYTRQYTTGTIYFAERFDGKEADNTNMYDTLDYHEGVKAYCRSCNRYLGNTKANEVSKRTQHMVDWGC